MPVNYDGQWEARVKYTTLIGGVSIPHQFTFDFRAADDYAPGVAYLDFDTETHGATIEPFKDMVDGLVTLVAEAYETTADFNTVEIWKYGAEPDLNATFVTGGVIGIAGLAGGSSIAAQQATLTFRSAGGGIMRLQLMEVVTNLNSQLSYPSSSTVYNDIMAYVLDPTHAFLARDNQRPIFGLKQSFGQNEVLWEKYNR